MEFQLLVGGSMAVLALLRHMDAPLGRNTRESVQTN
jgi:hypothetical protein